MSKEIIIKSPIKILTERSNCTQLNDGEIGIYQPPYRYKNADETIGDFKCKKVQIYTKINGEIRKTNTYKPTNFIHYKEMPMHPFPYEVYYTHAIVTRIKTINGVFTFEKPRFHDNLLAELASGASPITFYDSFVRKNAYIRECETGAITLLKDVPLSIYSNTISINLTSFAGSYQLVIPLSSLSERNGDKSIKNNYYALTKTGFGFRITKIPKPIDKVPTMRRIKKVYFRKKRKCYLTTSKDRIFPDFPTGKKYYRYAAEPNFNPLLPKRFGKYCTYFCIIKHNNHKKIHTLPNGYFVVRKGNNYLSNQTV